MGGDLSIGGVSDNRGDLPKLKRLLPGFRFNNAHNQYNDAYERAAYVETRDNRDGSVMHRTFDEQGRVTAQWERYPSKDRDSEEYSENHRFKIGEFEYWGDDDGIRFVTYEGVTYHDSDRDGFLSEQEKRDAEAAADKFRQNPST